MVANRECECARENLEGEGAGKEGAEGRGWAWGVSKEGEGKISNCPSP